MNGWYIFAIRSLKYCNCPSGHSAAYSRYINLETGIKSSGEIVLALSLGMQSEYHLICTSGRHHA